MEQNLEIALIKYNKKTWCKSALLGFFVGLAVIVPGISGSTVAIIFKLYDQFLYAVSNLFKSFKKCFAFLLPIGIGLVAGILLGFIGVKTVLDLLPFAVICLFAGLMSGAFPAVKDELKGAERTPLRIALFALGLCLPVAIGCVSAFATSTDGGDMFATVQWWHFFAAFAIGCVFGITQIVPGLSGSALLMMVGWFHSLMQSFSLTYWQTNPAVFIVYVGLGLGIIAGVFAFSKLLTYVFGKARHTAYSLIVGLSLGSIISMFCNGDIIGVYYGWATGTGNVLLDVLLGAALFVIGCVGAYLLVRVQRKQDAKDERVD